MLQKMKKHKINNPTLRNLMLTILGKNRDRTFIFKSVPKYSVCAEIGVWKGDFSLEIYNKTNPTKLYLIDNWDSTTRKDIETNEQLLEHYNEVKQKFEKKHNVEIIRANSKDGIELIPNSVLDWAYLDASHDYVNVTNDLIALTSKIKTGGLIIGDDYTKKFDNGYHFRVIEAVTDFVEDYPFKLIKVKKKQFFLRKYNIR